MHACCVADTEGLPHSTPHLDMHSSTPVAESVIHSGTRPMHDCCVAATPCLPAFTPHPEPQPPICHPP